MNWSKLQTSIKEMDIAAIALFVFLTCFTVTGFAQSGVPYGSCGIEYVYDAAGNVVQRQYVCNNSARIMNPSEAFLVGTIGKAIEGKSFENLQKVDMLYPNPTTGIFRIKMTKPIRDGQIFISDANGKAVDQKTFSGSLIELNLQHRPAGVYYVKLVDGKEMFSFTVVKQQN